jgi:hypothetical protein
MVCSALSVTWPVGVGCIAGGAHVAVEGSPVSMFDAYTESDEPLAWHVPSGVRTNAGFPLHLAEL